MNNLRQQFISEKEKKHSGDLATILFETCNEKYIQWLESKINQQKEKTYTQSEVCNLFKKLEHETIEEESHSYPIAIKAGCGNPYDCYFKTIEGKCNTKMKCTHRQL